MNDHLTRLLEASGIETPRIQAGYFLKLGAFLCQPAKRDCQAANSSKAHMSQTTGRSTPCVDVIEALKKHRNVFEVEVVRERPNATRDTPYGLLLFGDMAMCRINLPKAVQKYCNEPWAADSPESFEVVISGSIFATYVEMRSWPYYAHIAHEFRELLHDHINSTTSYHVPTFGPSPIHPDFYILFLQQEEPPSKAVRVFELKGDVFLLFPAQADIREIVTQIVQSVEFPLSYFYSAGAQRADILERTDALHAGFHVLNDVLRKRRETPWFRVVKRARLDSEATSQISQIYEAVFLAQAAEFQYNEERVEAIARVSTEPTLSPVSEYLSQHLEDVLRVPECLLPALEHSAQHVSTASGARIAVVASILGAALGAILTAVFTG